MKLFGWKDRNPGKPEKVQPTVSPAVDDAHACCGGAGHEHAKDAHECCGGKGHKDTAGAEHKCCGGHHHGH